MSHDDGAPKLRKLARPDPAGRRNRSGRPLTIVLPGSTRSTWQDVDHLRRQELERTRVEWKIVRG